MNETDRLLAAHARLMLRLGRQRGDTAVDASVTRNLRARLACVRRALSACEADTPALPKRGRMRPPGFMAGYCLRVDYCLRVGARDQTRAHFARRRDRARKQWGAR